MRNPTDLQVTQYAESYVLYGDQTKALKSAFPKSEMKPNSWHVEASKFHDLPKVVLRVDELYESINSEANDKALYTAAQAIQELNDAMDLAKEMEQPSPVVAAVMGKAKIAGLLIDQVKTEDVTPPKIEYVIPDADNADHAAG